MKSIILTLTMVFASQMVMAQESNISCGYNDVKNIISYSDSSTEMTARALSKDEIKLMESYFDDSWDCDEGVELIGPQKTAKGMEYSGVCYKDSLGAATVELKLECSNK